ncbi:acyl-CoA carboxylase subunit beta [Nocardioides sp. L-11A]|uniref:acyl-CoA carboxylase subunit beta n=1 Tax=Nocardioides sp. L-11A TaxID=3043848 RepID=UPI002499C4BC|nr:carboxyl transferase domain-containing protein [Nocardioides sp. L-11A]
MSFTWQRALERLDEHRQVARALGGEERVGRQHEQGRLTIRERIATIAESFTEVGEFASFPVRDASGADVGRLSSSYVCGLATVDGRQVAIGGEDFTVRAGAPQTYLDRYKGGMGGFVEDLAHQYRIPLVLFMEGIGGDVSAQDEVGHSYLVSSMSWKRSLELMGEVPVLVAVLGSAAGGTAGRTVLSHFSVISEGSVLFAGGPPVVRRALGRDVDKHELGGARMHTSVSGAVDNLVGDEEAAISQIRTVLGYLPQNVWELPPRGGRTDPVDRPCDAILEIVPENRRRPYRMKDAMAEVVDRGSFFEMGVDWGRAVITAFARIDGIPVGLVGNNPMHLAGALDASAAEKQIRFTDLCSTFHLPIVHFVDVPGFMVGPEAERGNVVRWGMRAIQALVEAEVPVVTIHVRKAYGMAVSATSDPDALGLRIAWPSSEWGDMPIEGGVEAGFRREIEQAEDPEAFRREVEERLLEASDPWKTVEAFGMEMMIDPRETRRVVAEFLNASLHGMRTRLGPRQKPWSMRP